MIHITLKTISLLQEQEPPLVFIIILLTLVLITAVLVAFVVFRGIFNFFEMARVEYFTKQQFYTHFYLIRKTVTKEERLILKKEFDFYNRLTTSEKKNFEHRLYYYLNSWQFIGNDMDVTKKMKVLIAATAAKITFGFRNYKIESIDKVILYPREYYSTINKQKHKGEFNPAYKALVFSWEDFLKGYKISDDNLNLGVHEFIHALHFTFLKSRRYSTSAAIFLDSFYELTHMLDNNEALKEKLISSGYFREYAFENHFEFISVIAENFVETPSEFRSKFPKIYKKVKEMLNFYFAGY
ncbi:zinc-dependent peptidase [Oceanihabitans sediminis]|uniref:DgsA anti-repressor MtfA n=1 Tax=Oceanihabitans sediminis TaxID=1812012 RepID=A0A368P8J8_9FLAO|nr:zinc-dependent peptidase [Oceanihabitans sediminis]MDX1277641.1 zinc-dependent peptidase [Oceanihabitans sediminis]RBP32069.1 hypothetical protein DFR65_103106 [Oceanihabitans sediminis]RCU58723.1 hypothetical protein DU428_04955 [Oceanihabitans sediminis]